MPRRNREAVKGGGVLESLSENNYRVTSSEAKQEESAMSDSGTGANQSEADDGDQDGTTARQSMSSTRERDPSDETDDFDVDDSDDDESVVIPRRPRQKISRLPYVVDEDSDEEADVSEEDNEDSDEEADVSEEEGDNSESDESFEASDSSESEEDFGDEGEDLCSDDDLLRPQPKSHRGDNQQPKGHGASAIVTRLRSRKVANTPKKEKGLPSPKKILHSRADESESESESEAEEQDSVALDDGGDEGVGDDEGVGEDERDGEDEGDGEDEDDGDDEGDGEEEADGEEEGNGDDEVDENHFLEETAAGSFAESTEGQDPDQQGKNTDAEELDTEAEDDSEEEFATSQRDTMTKSSSSLQTKMKALSISRAATNSTINSDQQQMEPYLQAEETEGDEDEDVVIAVVVDDDADSAAGEAVSAVVESPPSAKRSSTDNRNNARVKSRKGKDVTSRTKAANSVPAVLYDIGLQNSKTPSVESARSDAEEHSTVSRMSSSSVRTPSSNDKNERRKKAVKEGKWSLGSQIGAGSFGVVHRGINEQNGEMIAIKVLNIPKPAQTDDINDLQREIDLMRKLSHPNIVQYLGSEIDVEKQTLYIFQEWVPAGSVSSMLKEYGAFSLPVVAKYLRHTLQGLDYLHSRNILHRDIKGGNILVNNAGVAKLADFGASKQFEGATGDDMMESVTVRGTPYFMAPEAFEKKYGRKADIWSIGGVAYQMYTGVPPWKDMKFESPTSLFLHLRASEGPPKISFDEEASDATRSQYSQLEALVSKCFHRDPSKRPHALQLLSNPFFEDKEAATEQDVFSPLIVNALRRVKPNPDSSLQPKGSRPSRRARNQKSREKEVATRPNPTVSSPSLDSKEWPTWARNKAKGSIKPSEQNLAAKTKKPLKDQQQPKGNKRDRVGKKDAPERALAMDENNPNSRNQNTIVDAVKNSNISKPSDNPFGRRRAKAGRR